ncbi:hypothetical protein IWQ62_003057 [Dispira parvispora]|uniref:Uncharacterized protein n=1 Tax=Dispira parvispora TaxID=1520584 RepID=A0A9W8AUV7_9FUNG|nr:hypothetical protein IWQ62_003057 [Dispira parvispora]
MAASDQSTTDISAADVRPLKESFERLCVYAGDILNYHQMQSTIATSNPVGLETHMKYLQTELDLFDGLCDRAMETLLNLKAQAATSLASIPTVPSGTGDSGSTMADVQSSRAARLQIARDILLGHQQ